MTTFPDELRRERLLRQDGLDQKLLRAALKGDVRGVKEALCDGARIDAKGQFGEQSLHNAVRSDEPGLIRVLLRAGADVNAKDSYGSTPLHASACAVIQPTIAKTLIEAGAKLNVRNNAGETPLHRARLHDNQAVAQLIKDAIADRGSNSDFRTRSRKKTDQQRER